MKNPTASSSELTHKKEIKIGLVSYSIFGFTCFYYLLAFNFEEWLGIQKNTKYKSTECKKKKRFNK